MSTLETYIVYTTRTRTNMYACGRGRERERERASSIVWKKTVYRSMTTGIKKLLNIDKKHIYTHAFVLKSGIN